jgi:mannose-6-phosphate isomerase-like protein (cupin superfamily)
VQVSSLATATPFTTKDGSTIRELHHTAAQSLAEATLAVGQSTERHYHLASEEIYFVLEGEGDLEIDGDRRRIAPGDAALIPAGAWHELVAASALRFLCCCAPAYSHEDTFFE